MTVMISITFMFQRKGREERSLKNNGETKRQIQIGCKTASLLPSDEHSQDMFLAVQLIMVPPKGQ